MVNFDFSGIKSLKADFTMKISEHLEEYTPFALKSRMGYTAVFVPRTLSALFINASGLTVTKCGNKQEFFNLIGLTVLSHREFTEVPVKILPLINENKQIE